MDADPSTAEPMPALPTLVALILAALVAGGCASMAPPATAPEPASVLDQRAALPAALVVERQWLQSWFQGTPVRIAQNGDAVTVDVPREFSFDAGRSQVKPPLAAVLDKVAESLRRLPLAQLTLLAAPDDSAGASALARQRAAQVQRHLRSRGVPTAQLGAPTATPAAAVQLRLEAPAH